MPTDAENQSPEGQGGDLPITSIMALRFLAISNAVEGRGVVEMAHRLRQGLSGVFPRAQRKDRGERSCRVSRQGAERQAAHEAAAVHHQRHPRLTGAN